METFDALVKKGKVRCLGASNYDTWRMAEANCLANAKGLTPYTVMQQRFTYLHPKFDAAPKYIFNESVGRERLRYLCDKDMPLVAYSCLAKGGYEVDARIPAEYTVDGRLAMIREMAKEKGVNTSALVVAWMVNLYRCAGFPRVIPLFASSRIEHFTDNLRGADMVLTDEELERLNRA